MSKKNRTIDRKAERIDFNELGIAIGMPPKHSTVIACYAYFVARQELCLMFRSGKVYRYYGVEEETFRKMLAADSMGKAFNELIRDNYKFELFAA